VSASELSIKQFDVDYVNEYLKMVFVPTLDYHKFIYKSPFEYEFQSNHDILAGINQNEGTYFTFYLYNTKYFNLNGFLDDDLKYDNQFVEERLHESLKTKYPYSECHPEDEVDSFYYSKYINCLASLYDKQYENDFKNGTVNFDIDKNSQLLAWNKYNKIVGDIMFACPSIKLANKYNEANPGKNTYFYKFNKRSKSNPWPKWLGVMHGYEIEYIFGVPFWNSQSYDDEDRLVSRQIMNYWANFARTGKL
jgi:hypothetical protein